MTLGQLGLLQRGANGETTPEKGTAEDLFALSKLRAG